MRVKTFGENVILHNIPACDRLEITPTTVYVHKGEEITAYRRSVGGKLIWLDPKNKGLTTTQARET